MIKINEQIEFNNNEIKSLKETIKKYYNKDIEDIMPYQIYNNENNFEEIIKKQRKDIAKLNIIIDVEEQKTSAEISKKIEKLKELETDEAFSTFYREGFICINNIDVSVDNFFIKKVVRDDSTFYNFICTDERIDKKIFNTFDDREYEVKRIYKLKDSTTFYEMYLDEKLFNGNKIIIDNNKSLKLFNDYINKWTPKKHRMVAETMLD